MGKRFRVRGYLQKRGSRRVRISGYLKRYPKRRRKKW